MGTEGEYGLIILYPGQVVLRDPDGLVEADKRTLAELMKPRTIRLPTFVINRSDLTEDQTK